MSVRTECLLSPAATGLGRCPSGSWEVEPLEACTKRLLRIDHFKVTQNGPVYKGSTWVTVELKVTGAGWSIDPVIHGRFLYTKGTGWGKSIEITQHGDCYRCDHNWSFSNLASTYKRTSINTTVIQDDLTTGSVVRPDVGIKLSIISLIGISQGVPGKTAKFHFTSPDLRCDRLDYLSRGRGGGCVYDQVKPTAWISDGKYPKPAALIRKAQSDHHYGNQIPLTRLVNRSEIRANRRAARALCRRIQYTCDEYPFAASRQGCQKRPDLCYWKDVPAAQNSGAGGVVGTMLHSRRVFDYEGFYVKVYTP